MAAALPHLTKDLSHWCHFERNEQSCALNCPLIAERPRVDVIPVSCYG